MAQRMSECTGDGSSGKTDNSNIESGLNIISKGSRPLNLAERSSTANYYPVPIKLTLAPLTDLFTRDVRY